MKIRLTYFTGTGNSQKILHTCIDKFVEARGRNRYPEPRFKPQKTHQILSN